MNKKELTTRVWYKVPVDTLLHELKIPNLTADYLPEVCRLNPQKITSTMLSLVERTIEEEGITLMPIKAALPTKKDEQHIECVVMLGGEEREVEQLLASDLGFERLANAREQDRSAPIIRR